MPCPKCGRESEVGLFCKKCFISKNLEFDAPEVIIIEKCGKCGKLLWKGKWQAVPLEKIVRSSVSYKIPKLDAILSVRAPEPAVGTGKAIVVLSVDGQEFKREIELRIRNGACGSCSKIAGNYYEAVLQLRGKVGKETLKEVTSFIKSLKEEVFITEMKKVDNGFDVYLSSKKAAEKVVRRFKQRTLETKRSYHQVSFDRQSSKHTYRFFYLMRF